MSNENTPHRAQSESHVVLRYRADIDGLRAIAVLAVVGFHAFPDRVGGGFVGVDIFFVISGFLISTIIFGRLMRNAFSFIEFYSHRVTRIFPALFLVLVASFAFGWFALHTDEYKQLGKHIAGGAGFVANLVLWGENGYFDNAAETKPLLHLWSLGIEEQFYIFWPLLLWGVWKARLNPLITIIGICAISFALNIRQVDGDAVAAFYSPGTRFWELLAGSVLAYITLYRRNLFDNFKHGLGAPFSTISRPYTPARNRETLHNLLSLLGAILISAGILVITKERAFPGWWALLPVVGTVLIIAAGPQAWLNRAVLSNRSLVWFGLISFPLYLWHWPLLSFARILTGETPSVAIRIFAVVVSVAFAWLTYRLVEKPIRFGRQRSGITILLVGLMMLVGSIGYIGFGENGFSFRYNPSANDYSTRATQLSGVGISACTDLVSATRSAYCAKTSATPRTALVGDSHARHLFYGFTQSKNDKFSQVIYIGASACQPTLGVEHREGCDRNLATAIDLIRNTSSIEYVILSAWHIYIESADAELRKKIIVGYDRTLALLKKSKAKIVFVIDTPSLKETPEICVTSPLPIRSAFKRIPSFCSGASKNDLTSHTEYDGMINKLRLAHPDVFFYDPSSLFCQKDKCKIFEKSKILYADEHHVSIYGSQYLVDDLVRELEASDR